MGRREAECENCSTVVDETELSNYQGNNICGDCFDEATGAGIGHEDPNDEFIE